MGKSEGDAARERAMDEEVLRAIAEVCAEGDTSRENFVRKLGPDVRAEFERQESTGFYEDDGPGYFGTLLAKARRCEASTYRPAAAADARRVIIACIDEQIADGQAYAVRTVLIRVAASYALCEAKRIRSEIAAAPPAVIACMGRLRADHLAEKLKLHPPLGESANLAEFYALARQDIRDEQRDLLRFNRLGVMPPCVTTASLRSAPRRRERRGRRRRCSTSRAGPGDDGPEAEPAECACALGGLDRQAIELDGPRPWCVPLWRVGRFGAVTPNLARVLLAVDRLERLR